ncbi:hypothetical protein M973_06665 [Francisella orientalis LADL 07-285A]|nr:hypothetical protein M973_06665 [Francisella orientalis LADL 07-285A]
MVKNTILKMLDDENLANIASQIAEVKEQREHHIKHYHK